MARLDTCLPMRFTAPILVLCALVAVQGTAQPAKDKDADYIKRFEKAFPKNTEILSFEDYATPERYDTLYMGPNLDNALTHVNNDQGGIAWGLAYRMISLNRMYGTTRDSKYLEANLKCIRAVIKVRDDKIGKKLWTGKIAPAWGCDKYAKRERAIFAVHTGTIT